MNVDSLKIAFNKISKAVEENKDYLTALDARAGDGDLGVSMIAGFKAVVDFLETNEETDLGKTFMKASKAFNGAAPSSLGTILSLGMMGIAKMLKGKEDCSIKELAYAMEKGLENIAVKAKSKQGEKTVIDALYPAVEALGLDAVTDKEALEKAATAAKEGAEATKNIKAVHGIAAYFGDQTIGWIDGGAEVGRIIFESLAAHSRDFSRELAAT